MQVDDIHPLASFLENHKSHLKHLRESGRPEVLTVNGEASVVVQDARAYQKLIDLIDSIDAHKVLSDRIASVDSGEPGIPADQVLAKVRERLGFNEE